MTKTISVEIEKLEFVLDAFSKIMIHAETPIRDYNKIVEARNWINDRILYAKTHEGLESDQEEAQQEQVKYQPSKSILDPDALSKDVFNSIASYLGWVPGLNDYILPEIKKKISRMTEDQAWEAYCIWNGLLSSWPTQLKNALDSIRNSKK